MAAHRWQRPAKSAGAGAAEVSAPGKGKGAASGMASKVGIKAARSSAGNRPIGCMVDSHQSLSCIMGLPRCLLHLATLSDP